MRARREEAWVVVAVWFHFRRNGERKLVARAVGYRIHRRH